MKALSVRAPWWWFILHGGKDIENRDWYTGFRGTVYLHAGKWWEWQDGLEEINAALSCVAPRMRSDLAAKWSVKLFDHDGFRGCIVGKVDIVGCVSASSSPWFFGKYGFVLANPVAFAKPIPFKGALGFFNVPDGIEVAA